LQAAFGLILARKAVGLRPDTIFEGWLYETTRLVASGGDARRYSAFAALSPD
jgi:hypothetical protein